MVYNKKWHQKYYQENKEKIKKKSKETYRAKNLNIHRAFTQEQFEQRMKENYGDKFEILTKYDNGEGDTLLKCKDCGNTFLMSNKSLLRGNNCRFCSRIKRTKSKYVFSQNVKNIHGDKIILIDEYIDSKSNIEVKCADCNYVWKIKPSHLIHEKSGCPICSAKKRGKNSRKTHEQFILDVYNIHETKLTIIGKYETAIKKLKIKCNICEYVWNTTPNSLLNRNGCPNCNHSKGEKKISDFLLLNNIIYYTQHTFSDCKSIQVLLFDFYLPEYNICIEYDGIQHFKAIDYFGGVERLKITQKNDKIKNEYCKQNNIKLMRISYTHYNEIENIIRLNILNIKNSVDKKEDIITVNSTSEKIFIGNQSEILYDNDSNEDIKPKIIDISLDS